MYIITTIVGKRRAFNIDASLEIFVEDHTKNVKILQLNASGITVCLGVYPTVVRCNEVLDEMMKSFSEGSKVFYMPAT